MSDDEKPYMRTARFTLHDPIRIWFARGGTRFNEARRTIWFWIMTVLSGFAGWLFGSPLAAFIWVVAFSIAVFIGAAGEVDRKVRWRSSVVPAGIGTLFGAGIVGLVWLLNRSPVADNAVLVSADTVAPADVVNADFVKQMELEQLRLGLRLVMEELDRRGEAFAEPQIEDAERDTPQQTAARQSLYALYDDYFQPAASALRNFTSGLDNQLGNLPWPTSPERSPGRMMSGFLTTIHRHDFEVIYNPFNNAIDRAHRDETPLRELQIRFQDSFCADERLAYWTQYAALGVTNFSRDTNDPYLRWDSSDRQLGAAIARTAAMPGIDHFQGEWEGCNGPAPWYNHRSRIRDLPQ